MKFLRQFLFLLFITISAFSVNASQNSNKKTKLTQEQIEAKKEAGKAIREERATKRAAQVESYKQEQAKNQTSPGIHPVPKISLDDQIEDERQAFLTEIETFEANDFTNKNVQTKTPTINVTNKTDKEDYSSMSLDKLSDEINTFDTSIKKLENSLKQINVADQDSFKQQEAVSIIEKSIEKAKRERTFCCDAYNEKYALENKNLDSDVPMTIHEIKRQSDMHATITAYVYNLFGWTVKPTEQEIVLSEQENLLLKKYYDQYVEICEQQHEQKMAHNFAQGKKHWLYAAPLTVEEKTAILRGIQKLQNATDEQAEK